MGKKNRAAAAATPFFMLLHFAQFDYNLGFDKKNKYTGPWRYSNLYTSWVFCR